MPEFTDILFEKRDGVAWATINRPDRLNAFRHQTVEELIAAFEDAWADNAVGVIVLTGAGEKRARETALALAKQSFTAATDALIGVTRLGMAGLTLYLGSEEGQEFAQAFKERRPPDVGRFRR